MSILGGFYIYRKENIEDQSMTDITGVVLFKNTGKQVIFGYFNISSNILRLTNKKPSINELADFNPINEFIYTNHYDLPNADKGIYYYHPENLKEFIRKCYIPPLQSTI